MANEFHKNLVSTDLHIIHAYTYANAGARTGATGFVAGDVGKVAKQTDNDSYWVLTATTPTWSELTNTSVSSGITQLTSDVTAGPGSGSQAATIANDAVTNAKAANMVTQTIKGRNTAGTGDPEDLAPSTVKTMLALTKSDVGLGSVDNTADTAKAIAGDVTGTLGASTVAKIRGVNVHTTAPTANQVLQYDSGNTRWAPTTLSSSGATYNSVTVSNTNTALTSASADYQLCTGTVPGQRFTLPDATTLTAGRTFVIVNKSSTLIPIFLNGGTLFTFLYPEQNTSCQVVSIGTAAGIWTKHQGLPSPLDHVVIIEEFFGTSTETGEIGEKNWSIVSTNGTATVAYQPGAVEADGIIRLSTSIDNDAAGALSIGTNVIDIGNGIICFDAHVKLFALGGTGVAALNVRVGFQDTTGTGDTANGAYFEYNGNSGTPPNWFCKTANASTRTSTDSGIQGSTSAHIQFTVIINSAGTQADFYMGGVFITSHTTNIPSGLVGPILRIYSNSLNAAAKSFDIDMVQVIKNFATTRV